jgi:tetratricopeptide (TPR) repeat protein
MKRTTEIISSKFRQIGTAFLVAHLILTLFGCDKPDRALGVAEVFHKYQTERVPGQKVGNVAEEHLKRGEMLSSVFHYALAGQILMVEGDLDAATKALNKAVAINPKIDGPHFLLAEVYYRLALFDMFDRGLCNVELLPLEKIPTAALHHGHLRIEIQELLAGGRPKSYTEALTSKGLDERARLSATMYLIMLAKNRLIPAAREAMEEIVQDLGLPKVLPVPTYKPDDRTKKILMIAQKEMEMAQQGAEMDTPPGIGVIEKDKMEALAARIRVLLMTK